MIFKKFGNSDVSSIGPVKSSVARGIRDQVIGWYAAALCESYPYLAESGLIDALIPKKETLHIAKCQGHIQIVMCQGEPIFFTTRDGPWCPTLRLVHKFPDMMKKLRVDTGAIKFVLAGADVMCPGLTSPGATMHDEADQGEAVAIYAENKENALAIGVLKMSTADIKSINKGHGVENLHFLTDGLWNHSKLG